MEALERLEPRQLLAESGAAGEIVRPEGTLYSDPLSLWTSTYQFKVTYVDERAMDRATLDSGDLTVYGPNGFASRARFYRSVSAGEAVASAWYKISAPGGVWDAADNGVYTVKLNPHQVRDAEGHSARALPVGYFTVDVPQYPSAVPSATRAQISIGLDVTRFGAIPDDGKDDTDAIQRAIDALPRDGDGVPDPATPIGGIVALPAGTFNTSRPLQLPSGVRLRGQGDATVIDNSSADPSRGAVELIATHSHGFNMRAAVERLRITTDAAKGVYATSMAGDVVGLMLSDLTISAGSVAIDLRNERLYQGDLRDITIEDPGSTALWIGPPGDWWSAINRIENFVVTGQARPNFRAELGMVVLAGDAMVEGLRIDATGAPATSLYARGLMNLSGLALNESSTNLPDGVLAIFEEGDNIQIDRLGPLSAERRIEVRGTNSVQIGQLLVANGARVIDAASADTASHVRIEALQLGGLNPGPLDPMRFTVGAVEPLKVDPVPIESLPGSSGSSASFRAGPLSGRIVNVLEFGATPNDNIDDTAAIQRAIDALPIGDDFAADGSVGGTVLLPAGKFFTTSSLRLPSGVWLRGEGYATVIYNTAAAGTAAVEFVGGASHGYNIGAGVADVSIHTARAAGIRADASIHSGLVDASILDVQIGPGGVGIDLSATRAYHALLRNVVIADPGTATLHLGDRDGYSAGNRIIGLQLRGSPRRDFHADGALVTLGDEYALENSWIEQPGAPALPLHVSGSASIRGLWLEYPADQLPTGVVMQFENISRVRVDRLLHVGPERRLNLVNARDVRIEMLSLHGTSATLRDVVAVDDGSRLSIGVVNASRDSGLLDHPRVRVESVYNVFDNLLLENRAPEASDNLVIDPLFDVFNLTKDRAIPLELGDAWTVTWGDNLGRVTGTIAVVDGPYGPRLRVDITSNPNNRAVAIIGRLNVPSSLVGRAAVARWRMDGPKTVLVYTGGYALQYSARAMNGATAVRVPGNLQGDDQIIFLLREAAIGTYYISQVSVSPL